MPLKIFVVVIPEEGWAWPITTTKINKDAFCDSDNEYGSLGCQGTLGFHFIVLGFGCLSSGVGLDF